MNALGKVRVVILPTCFCLLAGCSAIAPAKVDVSGNITLAGKAPRVPGRLEIAFACPDGAVATAVVDETGAYRAEGVTSGESRVYFVYVTRAAIEQGNGNGSGRKLAKPDPGKTGTPKQWGPEIPNPVPEKLRQATTTDLVFKVEPGKENVFDYDLVAK
jgi:hypothetical protein